MTKYDVNQRLTTREYLKKFNKQRVRFTGVVAKAHFLARHRVNICLSNVEVIGGVCIDHLWINVADSWYIKRKDDFIFGKTKITGTGVVRPYTRRPKQPYSTDESVAKSLGFMVSSVDYGIAEFKKLEILEKKED